MSSLAWEMAMYSMRGSQTAIESVGPLRRLAAIGILSTTLSCTDAHEEPEGVPIGLLLPFSGTHSATSANFERAAIYAVDRLNVASEVRRSRFRLVAADTHSDPARSIESAQRLADEGVSVVLGLESSEVAATVEPLLSERNVSLLSPLVGTADDARVNCENRWFRLAPAAATLGEALAKQLFAESVPSVVILSETDRYSQAFADALQSRFTSLGGVVDLRADVDSRAGSYAKELAPLPNTGRTNIVLSASPRTAALLVNEYVITKSGSVNWYLSPLLKTDLFIQNVIYGSLNNAKGVAPRIFAKDEFAQAFEARWEGEPPLEGAYFYYDAVAIAAYALEFVQTHDGTISQEAFKQAVFRVSTTLGRATAWHELDAGLRGIAEGAQVYYTGVTGPAGFDACGARLIGTFTPWTIKEGKIVDASEG